MKADKELLEYLKKRQQFTAKTKEGVPIAEFKYIYSLGKEDAFKELIDILEADWT